MSLEDIVNVQITRQTTAVTRAGFGTVLVLTPEANFTERIRFYSSIDSVDDDLVGGSNALAYAAAQALFGQSPSPTQVAIGNQQGTKTITDDAGTYTAGSVKTTVSGTDVITAWVTDKDTTLTAHAAAIQALSEVSTAVYTPGTHTIVITPAGVNLLSVVIDWSAITGTMTAAVTATGSEDHSDALDAIKLVDNDWYGIVSVSHVVADVQDIAAWTETQRKLFGTSSADTDIINVAAASDNPTTGTIAARLNGSNLARSHCLYSAQADTKYPEAAVFGVFVTQDPGSYTVAFKTLALITADALTDTQVKNALDKKCNIYHEVGGVDITQEGTVAEGEYIDTIVFIDWLQARMTENIFAQLVNLPKIPFTDDGISVVEGEVKGMLQQGIDAGGLTDDPAPVVTVLKASEVQPADKLARLLKDVKFTATLAGAIHAVEVNGFVSV